MEWVVVGRFLSQKVGIGLLLRKNRIEKGSQADSKGSNPHSYGDSFSLFGFIKANRLFSSTSIIDRVRVVVMTIVIMFIILL